MIYKIVQGNSFKLHVLVRKPDISSDSSKLIDFDMTKATDIKVALTCDFGESMTIPSHVSMVLPNVVVCDVPSTLEIGNYNVSVSWKMDGNDMASVERNLFRIVEYNSQVRCPICMVDGDTCKETEVATAIVVLPPTIELWQLVNLTSATIEEAEELSRKMADAEEERASNESARVTAEKERERKTSEALRGLSDAQGGNLESIEQVQKSDEDGGINIIQATLKNGEKKDFLILNGSKGSPGEKGEKGDKGADGGFADLGDIKVSVDATTGTPSASVSNVLGSDGKAQLTFKFSGIKGEKGEDGKDGVNGTDGAKGDKGDAFTFADFTNEQLASLKGEKGDKGDMGSISKVGVSVDSEIGTPSATATVSKNTDGSTNIDFSFTGLKGEKGDKGEDGTGTNVTQKVSKARTRIVCRKAIRLGATKANGNLVKYFTHFPTISLKLDQKYIIYLNDVLVDVKALCDDYNAKSPYLCPTKFLSFSDSGEVSFAYNAEGYFDNAKTFSVPIDIHQSQGYLYHVDKVTLLESGVYEVRVVKGKTERDFSYNTDNVYLTISNGKLVSKVANIGMVELSRDKWIVDAKGKNFVFESYVKARVRKRRSKMNEDQARRKTDWYKYRMIPFSWVKAIGKTGLWKHYLYYKGILVSESRFILSRIYGDTDDVIYNIMRV